MSACRGCGLEIVWAIGPAGQKIPLDPAAPLFVIARESIVLDANGRIDRSVPFRVVALPAFSLARHPVILVSHFSTCSKAADFSGRNRSASTRPGLGLDSVPGGA